MGVQGCDLLPAYQLWADYGEDYGGDELCRWVELATRDVQAAKNYQFTWSKYEYRGIIKGTPTMAEEARWYQASKVDACDELHLINYQFGACGPRCEGVLDGCMSQTSYGGYETNVGAMITDARTDAYWLTATNSWPDRPLCHWEYVNGEPRVGVSDIVPKSEWAMLLIQYDEKMTDLFGSVGATIITGIGIALGALALFAAPWLVLKIGAWVLSLYSSHVVERYVQDVEILRGIQEKIAQVRSRVQRKIYIEEQKQREEEAKRAMAPLAILGGLAVMGLAGQ